MMKRLIYVFLVAILLFPSLLRAIPAYPYPVKVLQPDGEYVTLCAHGDEFMNYLSTEDGYTVIRNESGYYVYAELKKGKLSPTVYQAKEPTLRSVAEREYLTKTGKHLLADAPHTRALRTAANTDYISKGLLKEMRSSESSRSFRGLVVLVEFDDKEFIREDANGVFTDMMNREKYDGYMSGTTHVRYTGSVRDYFYDNSLGDFDPQFDVIGPVKVPYSQTYINQSENANALIEAACAAIDDRVDYRNYDGNGDGIVDMVYFIFAGHGSNVVGNNPRYVWPHAYSFFNFSLDGVDLGRYACSTELGGSDRENVPMLDGIGTICHEFSHVLGLPDLYDTDYEGSGGIGLHPGFWSVMASAGYLNRSRTPCSFSLYERYALGWSNPHVITQEGNYTLQALSNSNEGYRIDTPVKNEFFLLENRQQIGWDSYLPGHGMLVFRVDSTDWRPWAYNRVNTNPNRLYYEMIRANGGRNIMGDSESDPFPGTGNVTDLSNFETTPNLLSWAGERSKLIIADITEKSGVVTFNANKDVLRYYLEDFESMVTTADASSVQGTFSYWKLEKAQIQAPGSDKANGKHSIGMLKGARITTTTPVDIKVKTAAFTVWNPTSVPLTLRLVYSTNGGKMWTGSTTLSGEQNVVVAPGEHSQLAFNIKSSLSTVYRLTVVSGSTTEMCYLDDFILNYDFKIATGVNELEMSDKNIPWTFYRENDCVMIESDKDIDSDVFLYSTDGVLIDRSAWQDGKVTFQLPRRGLYLLHCNGRSLKLVY